MTNHAELSRDLALALGYYPESARIYAKGTAQECCQVYRLPPTPLINWSVWMKFNYTDPTVCLPLIEWLMREHDVSMTFSPDAKQFAVLRAGGRGMEMIDEWADTFAECVARAVIAVKGKP